MLAPTPDFPAGIQTLSPYLSVERPLALIDFCVQALGAREVLRHSDDAGRLVNAQLVFGDCVLMLSEASADYPAQPCALYLYLEDLDAAYARALAQGAQGILPPRETAYGDRNAGINDPAGNTWWLAQRMAV